MKQALIYETLNQVKEMTVTKSESGLMSLSGVFGVCGVRNNNQRVYETSNYSKMVSEMKERIKNEGGIPGELEHPQMMNITLENVSHKITDININEDGVVTGTIELLNTPKGKIAQAIVEGGLPLFISSRATGQVGKAGNVTLERIATYDLVGSPGFSQARLKLNEKQTFESITESICVISEEVDENETKDMDKSILERLEALEAEVAALREENEQLRENNESVDLKKLADGVQHWCINEFAPTIQKWINEEYEPKLVETLTESIKEEMTQKIIEAYRQDFVHEMAPRIQHWVINEFAPEIQSWVTEEFAPVVEKWVINEFAPGVQEWVINEFAPETQKWVQESFAPSFSETLKESLKEHVANNRKDTLQDIREALAVIESVEPGKPAYKGGAVITEGLNEPAYVAQMPESSRVKWNLASQEVKESIHRRAKLYDFTNEGAIQRFWESIEFENIKPATSIYEGMENMDERERNIRLAFRRNRRNLMA